MQEEKTSSIEKINIPLEVEKNIDSNQERIKTPEQFEAFEKNEENINEKKSENTGEGEIGGIVAAGRVSQQQSEKEKKVEKILESGLENVYLSMTPEKQVEFKKAGEETTKKIVEIISAGKVKVRKIINLIKKWLILIPGINKYFLEQEAKIKTDEIIKLK